MAHKTEVAQREVVDPVLFEEIDGVYVNLQREKQVKAEIKVGIAYDGRKQTGIDCFTLAHYVVMARFSKAKEFQVHLEAEIAENITLMSLKCI